MLYLAFIFHMHQPYYKNLLTQESPLPWVRLHATKDYSDMVLVLEKFPQIHQTFNLVPSLVEQINDYVNGNLKDKFQLISYKKTEDLSSQDKEFIRHNFFHINPERIISLFPRYYQLYLKSLNKEVYTKQDYLDLVCWFNLAWIDPYFRNESPELKALVSQARFFSEEDKLTILSKQKEIIKNTISVYKRFSDSGQIEITTTPYYHPILPLLYNTKVALEANPKTIIPKDKIFNYPEDAKEQVMSAVKFHEQTFGNKPYGMWPSEESVSEHILPYIIESGINWIVTDEAILFKTIKKKRKADLLYQPYLIESKEGALNIVFRDRHLSDLISFVYHRWKTEDSVNDFMQHLENISKVFKDDDCLVTVALDGENAWEYYPNDGHNFLSLLYQRLSEAKFLKTVTVCEYLNLHPTRQKLKRLKPGSWINADFTKWIGNYYKNKAWEYLIDARNELENQRPKIKNQNLDLALKQMYILEGSDWFWWYGDKSIEFDRLFRMHLSNLYRIIGKEMPKYLNTPLEPQEQAKVIDSR